MRKFTKGLLMTLVASAMSMGAFAQDVNGYFRVVNVGYYLNEKAGVVNVSSAVSAQPDATKADAESMAGTVMYIATEATPGKQVDDQYVISNDRDLLVKNLRSQAVDADSAVYEPMVKNIRGYLLDAVKLQNTGDSWGLTDAEVEAVVEEMFSHMKMYLEPVENFADQTMDGDFKTEGQYFYLKSTTPRIDPLFDALEAKGFTNIDKSFVWNNMMQNTLKYYQDNKMPQAYAEWFFFTNRIHLGHTYYLIGGRVEYSPEFGDTPNTVQEHKPGDSPFISFANYNTTDYVYLNPEITVADKYAIWKLVPVDEANPFIVKGGVTGLRDGKYYTTGYFDFPFEPAKGVVAYGIKEVKEPKAWQSTVEPGQDVAYVEPEAYSGTVPAKTPVVIESADGNAILQPVAEPADEGDASVMKGIFFDTTFEEMVQGGGDPEETFDYYEFPTDEYTVNQIAGPVKVARQFMRVFNKTTAPIHANNPIGFFYYNKLPIKANKGWIDMTTLDLAPEVDLTKANVVIVSGDNFADGITEVASAKNSSNVVYDIQGRIVTNPTKGLYIVNGKKVIK